MTEEETTHKALMAGAGAASIGSAGALALYQGDIAEGTEYLSQAKDLVEPVFYDPEMPGSSASNMKEYAIGNVDTLMHGMAGAGISGAVNSKLEPSNRTKGLLAGIASGAIGYTMLKEGMYEGAFETMNLGLDSIQNAANPAEHVAGEISDLEYNADQKRDAGADTVGVLTERSLSSGPKNSVEAEVPELEPEIESSKGLGDILEETQDHDVNYNERDVDHIPGEESWNVDSEGLGDQEVLSPDASASYNNSVGATAS